MAQTAVAQYLAARAAQASSAPATAAPMASPAVDRTGLAQYLQGSGNYTSSNAPPTVITPASTPSTDGSSSSNSGIGTGIDVGALQAFPGGGNLGTMPGGVMDGGTPSPGNATAAPLPETSGASPNTNAGESGLSFAQVENFWIQAGGSPQAAAMAAAVADAESGLNAAAQRTNPDGSVGVGLWLIPANGTPPGSTDPLSNARAAVQLSQGGTDWTQWCSTWSDNNCGQNNGTYLGAGANALMSLAGQKPGAAYNVFGATPAGTGVGASSATSGLSVGSNSGSSSKLPILIGGLLIAVVVTIWLVNRKKAGKDTDSSSKDLPVESPSDTGPVYVPAHTRAR